MSVYCCGGSCVEDVTSHLMRHLSYYPTLRTCSSDTILRAILRAIKAYNEQIAALDNQQKKVSELLDAIDNLKIELKKKAGLHGAQLKMVYRDLCLCIKYVNNLAFSANR